MYQTIVLGLGFLLLVGGAYLIKRTDQSGVIQNTISTASSTQYDAASITGTYICDTDSKCQNPRILTMTDDGELTLTTSYDNGVEVLRENGSWKMDSEGNVTFIITGTPTELYEEPFTLLLKRVSSSTIVAAKSAKVLYKEWGAPIFRKQETQAE